MKHIVYASLVLGAIGCGSSDTTDLPPCNPLGEKACLMPWPSMAYLAEDSTSVTGYRVALPAEAMPVNVSMAAVDPAPFNRWDGFSPSGPMLAGFATGVSAAGLPPHTDPAASLAADSPIILLDLDRNERAPFFAEVDMNTPILEDRTLIIRPLKRLNPATHYAVAIRKAVKAADGSELPIPPAFAELVAGGSPDNPRLAGAAARYAEIFAALEGQGVQRTDLVLAWDFVTASDEFLTADLLSMRAQALPAIGDAGANLTFTLTDRGGNTWVRNQLSGTFKSPNFLDNGEEIESMLRRGSDGLPVMEGMRDANITVIVPRCVETAGAPIPVIVFGHGLFGTGRQYLDDSFAQATAQRYCVVMVAGDFIGLTSRQVSVAALAVNDLNLAGGIVDKLAQSVIDFISLENLARGPLLAHPALRFNDQPVIDPSRVYYLGASLGGIMGNLFMAYDPVITRGVLGVPGGNWSLLFERSFAWAALGGAMIGSYEDQYLYQVLVAMLGMRFEPFDPITTAPGILADPLPDTPAKQLLMYEAVGDCLVTNVSTEMMARTMGLDVVGPSFKEPWDLTVSTEPVLSGLTIYNESPSPLPPDTNVPPDIENGTHGGVNEWPAVLRQGTQFLFNGVITNECAIGDTPSVCDCTAGACN